jgi:tetratricopeptide (TPR) repeat protein
VSAGRFGSFGWQLAVVFLAALLVRLVYLWELREADVSYVLVGDGLVYHEWARDIARGRWMGDAVFYQAPLYPYFLAVLYAVVPPSFLVVRMVQALLGAAACVWLGLAGRAFFSPGIGILAGGLLAAYGPAVFFDGLIQKAVLDLFLLTALLALLGRVWERRSSGAGGPALLGAGLVLGLLTLTRENAIVLAAVVPAWLLAGFRAVPWQRRLAGAGIFVLGVGLVLLPVGSRNYAVGGEFFLTTAQFGPNFYIGNHAGADGLYAPLRWGRGDARSERTDATRIAEAALGRPLPPSEVSRYWTGRALAYIRSEPVAWLRLVAWKVYLTWNGQELIDTEDPAVYADDSRVLRGLLALVHFGTIVPLAAIGLVATWPDRRRLWLLYATIASITASVALFYVFGRYRYPLVPVVILFAAAGLAAAWVAVRSGRLARIAVFGGLAVLVGLAVNRPVASAELARAVMYRNLGVTLARQGEIERAVWYLGKSVEAKPTYLEARLSLARVLAGTGRRDEAIREYQELLRREPRLTDATTELRRLLAESAPGGGGPLRPGP